MHLVGRGKITILCNAVLSPLLHCSFIALGKVVIFSRSSIDWFVYLRGGFFKSFLQQICQTQKTNSLEGWDKGADLDRSRSRIFFKLLLLCLSHIILMLCGYHIRALLAFIITPNGLVLLNHKGWPNLLFTHTHRTHRQTNTNIQGWCATCGLSSGVTDLPNKQGSVLPEGPEHHHNTPPHTHCLTFTVWLINQVLTPPRLASYTAINKLLLLSAWNTLYTRNVQWMDSGETCWCNCWKDARETCGNTKTNYFSLQNFSTWWILFFWDWFVSRQNRLQRLAHWFSSLVLKSGMFSR